MGLSSTIEAKKNAAFDFIGISCRWIDDNCFLLGFASSTVLNLESYSLRLFIYLGKCRFSGVRNFSC